MKTEGFQGQTMHDHTETAVTRAELASNKLNLSDKL
jgi:hypothetical protein